MTRFVAEVGSNHNGDLDRAMRLMDAAAAIGCWAVKYQAYRADRMFAPEARCRGYGNGVEFPLEWLPALAAAAKRKGLQLGCSVYDVETVGEVWPHVDFLKVSSYSNMDDTLLSACFESGRDVMIATGMMSYREMMAMLKRHQGIGATLLHCVSQYPVRPEHCALRYIKWVPPDCRCGWSDHSGLPGVVLAAALRWNADVIECHLDLDGTGHEAGGHCWLPRDLAEVITTVKVADAATGHNVDKPVECERAEMDWRADPADGLRPMRTLRARWAVAGFTSEGV